MALKEARRSHRTRQALSLAIGAADTAPSTHQSSTTTTGLGDPPSPPLVPQIPRNPLRFDADNPPAFAPPGSKPALEPAPSATEKQHSRRASVTAMFTRSPVTARRRGSSIISEDMSGVAALADGGGGDSEGEKKRPGEDSNHGGSSTAGAGVEDGLSTPRRDRRGGRKASGPWPTMAAEVSSSGSTDILASDTGVSSSLRGGAGGSPGYDDGGGRHHRWRVPWRKRSNASGNSGGDNGSDYSVDSASWGGENLAAGEGDEMTDGEQQQQQGDVFPASPTLPPRLHSRGGKRPTEGKRSPRRKIRWGRVLGVAIALVSVIVALVCTFLSPPDGMKSSFSVLWQGLAVPVWGLRVYLSPGQEKGGLVGGGGVRALGDFNDGGQDGGRDGHDGRSDVDDDVARLREVESGDAA